MANRIGAGRVLCKHSSLKEYLTIVERERERYPLMQGELAGQDGNGKNLLIGTASARIYLKQWNHRVQNTLERRAEPLSALAMVYGRPYDQDFLRFAWKKLLENHTHDSICGCSVDEVHRQMVSRFESAWQIAEKVGEEALKFLVRQADTTTVAGSPLMVWNTCAYPRTDMVEAVMDFPEEEPMRPMRLLDAAGREIPCTLCWEPHTFTYRLPEDAFRVVEYVNRCRVRFLAEDVPAMGSALYSLVPEVPSIFEQLIHTDTSIENRWIRVSAAMDGSLTLEDKATGKCLTGWNVYEDVVDAGDEYMFAAAGSDVISTAGMPAQIGPDTLTADEAALVIRQTLLVPAGYDRKTKKVLDEKVSLKIRTRVSLDRESRYVRVHTEMENTAKNHRLRALFPHTVETDRVLAHGQFDLVERTIETGPRWTNPTNEQRMQAFVELRDDRQAMVVAAQGLHEYEVSRNGHKTLELTLLRAGRYSGRLGRFRDAGGTVLGIADGRLCCVDRGCGKPLPHGAGSAGLLCRGDAMCTGISGADRQPSCWKGLARLGGGRSVEYGAQAGGKRPGSGVAPIQSVRGAGRCRVAYRTGDFRCICGKSGGGTPGGESLNRRDGKAAFPKQGNPHADSYLCRNRREEGI